jgi:hypothetical protein
MRRAWRRSSARATAAGLAAAGLLLAAACSSAPPAPGTQPAADTRAAVAREYWRALAVIAPQLFPAGGGAGQFASCPAAGGGAATQVAYTISNGLLANGGQTAPAAFTSKLEQLLSAHGWSAFSGGTATASGGYRLTLQPVTGNASLSANLTLRGPCVTVGTAFASAAPTMALHDSYANADVTASPTPTSPLPSP